MEVGTIVGQFRRYLSIPMGGGVGVSQQRRDLGGIAFWSSWSIYGPAPWECCFLLEVTVRVWCRVAAGVEVVVEVFFEAGELGWIS